MKEDKMLIVNLVKIISNIRKKNPFADITNFERKINRFVYEQYGLTEDEIAIMEGRT